MNTVASGSTRNSTRNAQRHANQQAAHQRRFREMTAAARSVRGVRVNVSGHVIVPQFISRRVVHPCRRLIASSSVNDISSITSAMAVAPA